MSLPIVPALTCLDNLSRCGAACCKKITFTRAGGWSGIKTGQTITLNVRLNSDLRHYYRLHGLEVSRDWVRFFVGNHEIRGDLLILEQRCDWLTKELQCRGHTNGKKPNVCKDFGSNIRNPARVHIEETCIYHTEESL